MDSTDYCTDCKASTEIVLDHSTGDSICSECGLILESYFINETSEWRTFSDDNNDKDPSRVGDPSNPLLTHSNLSTVISVPKGIKIASLPPFQCNYVDKLQNPERNLTKGFEIIAGMADNLSLVGTVRTRAKEIYKKLEENKSFRGRNLNAISAACLFISCRELKSTRTLKEISSAAPGVSRKEINKAVNLIRKQLEVTMGTMQAGELVRRFCSNIGMKNQEMKAVQEAVEKTEDIDLRRNPKSVLAAIIYMITQLSDMKISLDDIARGVEVAEGTIKKSYRDVYPHASMLLPKWYASEEDINKLSCS